jgi:hypothetical protein
MNQVGRLVNSRDATRWRTATGKVFQQFTHRKRHHEPKRQTLKP